MLNYLKIEDFRQVVDVAEHCDWKRLNISIEEALSFDFEEVLGINYNYYVNLITDDREKNEVEQKLLNGSDYECGGITRKFLGLKRMLVYFAYSRYIMKSHDIDTGLGLKTKTDGFSIPTSVSDLVKYQALYKNMGLKISEQLQGFLCSHKNQLPDFLNINCRDCGCNDKSSIRATAHTDRIVKTIRKNDF